MYVRLWSSVVVAGALLAGCADASDSSRQMASRPPNPQVLRNQCLARIQGGASVPLPEGALTDAEWGRYVGCILSANMHVDLAQVPENPQAVVSMRVDSAGNVVAATLPQSSGNPAWDAAVQRAIKLSSPLPAAPATHRFARVDLHFQPRRQVMGMAGAPGLSGSSHWSIHHCVSNGNASVCN